MAASKKFPKEVRIILHKLRNGYPKGGVTIEATGEELPSGVYRAAHAAQYLIGEGWPGSTTFYVRCDHLEHDSFIPMSLAAAAASADKDLSLQVRRAPWQSSGQPALPVGELPAEEVERWRKAAREKRAKDSAKPPRPTGSAGEPRRPKPGGKCASYWELLDKLAAEANGVPERERVKAAAEAAGFAVASFMADYSSWKKWYSFHHPQLVRG